LPGRRYAFLRAALSGSALNGSAVNGGTVNGTFELVFTAARAVLFALIPACMPVKTEAPGAGRDNAAARPTVVEPRTSAGAPVEPIQEPPAAAMGLFAGVSLLGDPALVAAALAKRWCEHGDDSFRPPASGPVAPGDDYPARLGSCADVKITQHRRHESEGLTATLFSLSAVLENRELLLLQTAKNAALFELDRRREDESGEAGAVWREHLSIELRDVTGTATPEWIATTRERGGDSYEADHCYANTYEFRTLIVCSESEPGFRCFLAPYRKTYESAPRPEPGEDCGPAAKLEPPSTTGWALTVEVRRELAVFEVDGSVKLKGKGLEANNPFARTGEIPLASLFADAALPVGVLE
jgi:hypothetical protein